MTYTEEQRFSIVKDFLSSGLSQKQYATNQKMCTKTLRGYINTYRHQIEYGIKDDQRLRAVSSYTPIRDDEGNLIEARWTKVDIPFEDNLERLRDFAEGLKDEIPRAPIVRPPSYVVEDMLNFYVITDAHIGMRSNDWDLKTAEKVIKGWIEYMIKRTPDSHTGVLCFQGDTSHWDGHQAITPSSGHVLDADCGTRSMAYTVAQIIKYAINRTLTKHKHVHVLYIEGNHDPAMTRVGSVWLDLLFENEPRVTVDTGDDIYHAYEWGDVSIFSHHGHKRNITNITKVFAGMYRDLFGRTKYSYGHIGHYHHVKADEDQLMQIQIHPTLSGRDDYARFGGWLSQRGAKTIMYHKKFGEVDTATARPEMFL